MYDSDSDDGILRPNGFAEVTEDLVDIDLDAEDDKILEPPLKKRGRKKCKKEEETVDAPSNINETVDLSNSIYPEPPNSLAVENSDCAINFGEDSFDSVGMPRRTTRSATKQQREKKKLTTSNGVPQKPSATIDLEDSLSCDSPSFDLSLTNQSMFSFDMDEAPSPAAEDPNPEVTVRVNWKSGNLRSFNIRKFQKIKEIYTYYAQLEGVDEGRILFTLREKPVTPNDTPHSLNSNICPLEGGIIDVENVAAHTSQDAAATENDDDPNKIKLYFQRKGIKDKHVLSILPNEKVSVLLLHLSEDLGIPSTSMKIIFDGDTLDPESNVSDYDLEGDECLDLIIK